MRSFRKMDPFFTDGFKSFKFEYDCEKWRTITLTPYLVDPDIHYLDLENKVENSIKQFPKLQANLNDNEGRRRTREAVMEAFSYCVQWWRLHDEMLAKAIECAELECAEQSIH